MRSAYAILNKSRVPAIVNGGSISRRNDTLRWLQNEERIRIWIVSGYNQSRYI